MEIKSNPRITKKDIPFLSCLVLFGLVLFLWYTWAIPLIDPDEPRYAATANDMVRNNHWIVPHFNGAPRINKPPLFYWTIAIVYKIFWDKRVHSTITLSPGGPWHGADCLSVGEKA